MDIHELEIRNLQARRQVAVFQASAHPDRFGAIDEEFHRFKNRHPFHGFVPVESAGCRAAMFSGNDDLVAMCFFWHGPNSFEPTSLALWQDMARDASHAFDVGAFSGIYSLLAATANPEIEIDAFEPSRRTHGRLLLNIYANGLEKRVRARNCAVAAEPGELRLLQFRGEQVLGNGASLIDKGLPVTDGEERVATVALDDFVRETGRRPDLVKMDVEGAELLALAGMEELLSETRPRLIIEVTPKTYRGVREVLGRHGYRIRVIDEFAGTLSSPGEMATVGNILAEQDSSDLP